MNSPPLTNHKVSMRIKATFYTDSGKDLNFCHLA